MAQRHMRVLGGVAGAALVFALAPGAIAAPPPSDDVAKAPRSDNLPNPLAEAQADLRAEAVAKLIKGEATTEERGGQRVIKLSGSDAAKAKGTNAGQDKYVSYPVNREESIFTVLVEFGDQISPYGGDAGPMHNAIPEPDRVWDGSATDNNSTYWVDDFNRDHYQQMMFGSGESFKDFYLKQSNGRFLAKGDTSDWVKVPYNEARYGSNNLPSDAAGYWPFVRDTAKAWYNDQKAAGKSDTDIAAYLAQFDKVDRYDYDGDGNFNEPDGYIDHFQAIHAGEGEEAGGGAQGDDAIWSHRWYAYSNGAGVTGPSFNKLGGVPIGTSGMWIGDYTTEPENGGLGVFTHEFGHDLGLADYYDTAGGDNSTAFWTLMSSGSWLNWGTDAIGTTPGYMGPHEKLLLGWLDYTVANPNRDSYKLGPANLVTKDRDTTQALVVPLKDKTVTTSYNTPHSGSFEWWGGSADNLSTSLTRAVDLTGKTSASVSAWTWYNIEADYDALYTRVSTDGGGTWSDLTAAGQTKPLLDGDQRTWTQHTWDLSAYAGQQIQLRFFYATDGGLHYEGPFLDDLAITADGASLLSDDVEGGDNGWTANGFTRMGGSTSEQVSHYYLAENRIYSGYDATLQTGPYNFGWLNTMPDWVERFPYQNGMLVWYVDNQWGDNNTRVHPGHGRALPVDARPAPIVFADGGKLSNRRGAFDATFGQERTDAVTFHRLGAPLTVPSRPGITTFDDRNPMQYWDAANPWGSVQVAGAGVQVRVEGTKKGGDVLEVKVRMPR